MKAWKEKGEAGTALEKAELEQKSMGRMSSRLKFLENMKGIMSEEDYSSRVAKLREEAKKILLIKYERSKILSVKRITTLFLYFTINDLTRFFMASSCKICSRRSLLPCCHSPGIDSNMSKGIESTEEVELRLRKCA